MMNLRKIHDAITSASRNMTTYRCSVPECNFRIRVRGMNLQEESRWAALADDHSKH